jgi:hypothetical protein
MDSDAGVGTMILAAIRWLFGAWFDSVCDRGLQRECAELRERVALLESENEQLVEVIRGLEARS